MSYTTHYNLPEMPTGAVEWPALFNDLVAKVEAGRTLKLTAGETLAKGDPFYIKTADGKAWKASDTTTITGVWQSASTAASAQGYGQISGTMTFSSWASAGLYLYASSGKALTSTKPNPGSRPVAQSISTTVIEVLAPPDLQSLGSANQVLGTNAGAAAQEYKTVQGTADQVTVTHAANSITISAPVRQVDGFAAGKPGAGAIVQLLKTTRAFSFPANLTGSTGRANTAPADGAIAFSLKKNGVEFGTIDIAQSANNATFTSAAGASFAAGDVLTVVAPAGQDSAMADVGWTLVGAWS